MNRGRRVVLLVETAREYGRGILRGIAKFSRINGPWVFYREPGDEQRPLPNLGDWGAEGIISRVANEAEKKKILDTGLPVICIGLASEIPGLPNIACDNLAVGRMGAEYLLGRGFKRLAFCGFGDRCWSHERYEGFSRSVSRAGFEALLYQRPASRLQRSWEKEQLAVAEWLSSLDKPVALMACDDDRARHIIEAAKLVGIKIPEEVALLGVDNDELNCDLSNPPLSSIKLGTEEAGYLAAELLSKMMSGTEEMAEQRIVVRPLYVVTRQSTDIYAVEDKDVVNAIHFIHRCSEKLLQVQDVVDAVGVSRRKLEHGFRSYLGRSIHDEIAMAQVEQVAKMLLETHLSISQIAIQLGYTSAKHISRKFRNAKGVTPSGYRKIYGNR